MSGIKDRINTLRLARIIVEEIQAGGSTYKDYKRINKKSSFDEYNKYKDLHKIHGILEKNIDIVEARGGYDIYVPMWYDEDFIEKCINSGFVRWKAELKLKGSMKDEDD